jgi:hypothetical protein
MVTKVIVAMPGGKFTIFGQGHETLGEFIDAPQGPGAAVFQDWRMTLRTL